MDVAGKCGLSDMKATPSKLFAQFILAGDRGLNQQLLNNGMALLFHWVWLYLFRCTAVFNGA